MASPWIKLHQIALVLTDQSFDVHEPLVRRPSRPTGWIALGLLIGTFAVFIYSLYAEQDWLTSIALVCVPVLPLGLLLIDGKRHPPPEEQAYIGVEGLRLTHRRGEELLEYVIPLAAIRAIEVEAKLVHEARHGVHRWCQFRFSTARAGEFPNVLVNTRRPLHLLLGDLERFYALPGVAEIPMRLLGTERTIGHLLER